MAENTKTEFLKKPNHFAMVPALFLGPLLGVILLSFLNWLFTDDLWGFALLVGSLPVVYIVCGLCVPRAFKYQQTKKNFIYSCTVWGGFLGLLLGFGVFSIFTGPIGASCAFCTAVLYRFFLYLLWRLSPVVSV